jgi:hypothetical protein
MLNGGLGLLAEAAEAAASMVSDGLEVHHCAPKPLKCLEHLCFAASGGSTKQA